MQYMKLVVLTIVLLTSLGWAATTPAADVLDPNSVNIELLGSDVDQKYISTSELSEQVYTKAQTDATVEAAVSAEITNRQTQAGTLEAKVIQRQYHTGTQNCSTIDSFTVEVQAAQSPTDLSNYYTKGQTDATVEAGMSIEVNARQVQAGTLEAKVIQRQYHTGTQNSSTIDNFTDEVKAAQNNTDLSDYYTKGQTNATIENRVADMITGEITSPATDEVLTWNGSQWQNSPGGSGDSHWSITSENGIYNNNAGAVKLQTTLEVPHLVLTAESDPLFPYFWFTPNVVDPNQLDLTPADRTEVPAMGLNIHGSSDLYAAGQQYVRLIGDVSTLAFSQDGSGLDTFGLGYGRSYIGSNTALDIASITAGTTGEINLRIGNLSTPIIHAVNDSFTQRVGIATESPTHELSVYGMVDANVFFGCGSGLYDAVRTTEINTDQFEFVHTAGTDFSTEAWSDDFSSGSLGASIALTEYVPSSSDTTKIWYFIGTSSVYSDYQAASGFTAARSSDPAMTNSTLVTLLSTNYVTSPMGKWSMAWKFYDSSETPTVFSVGPNSTPGAGPIADGVCVMFNAGSMLLWNGTDSTPYSDVYTMQAWHDIQWVINPVDQTQEIFVDDVSVALIATTNLSYPQLFIAYLDGAAGTPDAAIDDFSYQHDGTIPTSRVLTLKSSGTNYWTKTGDVIANNNTGTVEVNKLRFLGTTDEQFIFSRDNDPNQWVDNAIIHFNPDIREIALWTGDTTNVYSSSIVIQPSQITLTGTTEITGYLTNNGSPIGGDSNWTKTGDTIENNNAGIVSITGTKHGNLGGTSVLGGGDVVGGIGDFSRLQFGEDGLDMRMYTIRTSDGCDSTIAAAAGTIDLNIGLPSPGADRSELILTPGSATLTLNYGMKVFGSFEVTETIEAAAFTIGGVPIGGTNYWTATGDTIANNNAGTVEIVGVQHFVSGPTTNIGMGDPSGGFDYSQIQFGPAGTSLNLMSGSSTGGTASFAVSPPAISIGIGDSGEMSNQVNIYPYSGLINGTAVLITGTTEIQANSTGGGGNLKVNGTIEATADITAPAFHGSAQYLTNLPTPEFTHGNILVEHPPVTTDRGDIKIIYDSVENYAYAVSPFWSGLDIYRAQIDDTDQIYVWEQVYADAEFSKPIGRNYAACFDPISREIYFFGGFNQADNTTEASAIKYNIDSNSVTILTDMYAPCYGGSAIRWADGKIWIIGGQAGTQGPDYGGIDACVSTGNGNEQRYDPNADTWDDGAYVGTIPYTKVAGQTVHIVQQQLSTRFGSTGEIVVIGWLDAFETSGDFYECTGNVYTGETWLYSTWTTTAPPHPTTRFVTVEGWMYSSASGGANTIELWSGGADDPYVSQEGWQACTVKWSRGEAWVDPDSGDICYQGGYVWNDVTAYCSNILFRCHAVSGKTFPRYVFPSIGHATNFTTLLYNAVDCAVTRTSPSSSSAIIFGGWNGSSGAASVNTYKYTLTGLIFAESIPDVVDNGWMDWNGSDVDSTWTKLADCDAGYKHHGIFSKGDYVYGFVGYVGADRGYVNAARIDAVTPAAWQAYQSTAQARLNFSGLSLGSAPFVSVTSKNPKRNVSVIDVTTSEAIIQMEEINPEYVSKGFIPVGDGYVDYAIIP
jgi:hypothetical protein